MRSDLEWLKGWVYRMRRKHQDYVGRKLLDQGYLFFRYLSDYDHRTDTASYTTVFLFKDHRDYIAFDYHTEQPRMAKLEYQALEAHFKAQERRQKIDNLLKTIDNL